MSFESAQLSVPTRFEEPLSTSGTTQLPNLTFRRHRTSRRWVHLALFLLTLATTTLAGSGHYLGFHSNFGLNEINFSWTALAIGGVWYSFTVLSILGAHEFGHYFACRYYRINASLPYFIPAPFFLTGTLGALIRIREPIPTKPMLFDIGVAGPLAGFIVACPALLIGVAFSRVTELPADFSGYSLGEPLLFQFVTWIFWGSIADGQSLNLHPMAFAAWFGLLATALNLFPAGQLDGGHISYAAFGRKSVLVTYGTVALTILLVFWSLSWLFWAILMIAILRFSGANHPRTHDEDLPLDNTRKLVAYVALAIFLICFTPAPIEVFHLIN